MHSPICRNSFLSLLVIVALAVFASGYTLPESDSETDVESNTYDFNSTNTTSVAEYGSNVDGWGKPKLPRVDDHDPICYPPKPLPEKPEFKCYELIQNVLQKFRFDKNYTLTSKKTGAAQMITLPVGWYAGTCAMRIDMFQSKPSIYIKGAWLADWMWDLQATCDGIDPETGKSVKSGGGKKVVDFYWDEAKKLEDSHNKIIIELHPYTRHITHTWSPEPEPTATETELPVVYAMATPAITTTTAELLQRPLATGFDTS